MNSRNRISMFILIITKYSITVTALIIKESETCFLLLKAVTGMEYFVCFHSEIKNKLFISKKQNLNDYL